MTDFIVSRQNYKNNFFGICDLSENISDVSFSIIG